MPSWILISLSFVIGIVTIALPFTNFGQHFFEFIKPQFSHLLFVVFLVACYFVATEITKICYYTLLNHKKT